jgi:hypothetical protein
MAAPLDLSAEESTCRQNFHIAVNTVFAFPVNLFFLTRAFFQRDDHIKFHTLIVKVGPQA